MKKNKSKTMIIIALIILIFVGINVRKSTVGFLFDDFLMGKIHSNISPFTTKLMKLITLLGSKYLMIIALLALVVYYMNKNKRRNARLVFVSIAGSYSVNAVLKLIFARTRPIEYMIVEKTGYSFPSGHSMVSMSFYTTMTYILLNEMEDSGLKNLIWILNFILIFLIGFSRLYLGVHWPTDVFIGFMMGYLIYYLGKENIKN